MRGATGGRKLRGLAIVARIDRSDPDVLAASERFGQLLRDMLTERDLKNNVLHRRSGVNAGYIGILASGHSPDGKANVPSNNILIQLGEGFAYNPLTKVVDPIAAAAYTNLFMDALRVKPTVIMPSGPETRVSKAFPRLIRAFLPYSWTCPLRVAIHRVRVSSPRTAVR